MSRTKTKKERKLLLKWLIALAAIAAVMVSTALILKSHPPSRETSPEPTAPTVIDHVFTYDENGFLSCAHCTSIPGIDVSHHQGVIDWPQVRAAGVEFAMIRLGYRGLQDRQLHVDEQVQQNLAGARAAGLKIGAYFFSQATTSAEAVAEAQFALEILGDTPLDLPLVFDWEYVNDSVPSAQVTGAALMDCTRSFCDTVAQAGFEPMVYFNLDLIRTRLDLKNLDYPFWLALYSQELRFDYPVRCWQYTDKGRIPGIQEDVDIDIYFP